MLVLLDGAESTGTLLAVCFALVLGYLLLVMVDKPFADGEQHEGLTAGDKAQVSVQLAMLMQLCLQGFWVVSGTLSQSGQIVSGVLAAIFTLSPIAYMQRLHTNQAKQVM